MWLFRKSLIAHIWNISCQPELDFHYNSANTRNFAFTQNFIDPKSIRHFSFTDRTQTTHVDCTKIFVVSSVQSQWFCTIEYVLLTCTQQFLSLTKRNMYSKCVKKITIIRDMVEYRVGPTFNGKNYSNPLCTSIRGMCQ